MAQQGCWNLSTSHRKCLEIQTHLHGGQEDVVVELACVTQLHLTCTHSRLHVHTAPHAATSIYLAPNTSFKLTSDQINIQSRITSSAANVGLRE